MPRCSAGGCGEPPVIQWQKLMSESDVDAHIEHIQRRLEEAAEPRRFDIRVGIAALQEAVDNPPTFLSPKDQERFRERGRAQIEEAQKEHNNVQRTFDLTHQRENSTRAQFHCAKHCHRLEEDLDWGWYAVAHGVDCSGERGCGCS